MRRIAHLGLALLLAPALAYAQRTSVGRDFPLYANGGKPDLTVDPQRLESQMEIVDRYFDEVKDACIFAEYAVGGPGYRRLLRFDTVVLNRGGSDLVVGDRSDPNNPYAAWFYYAACHGHYHIADFSMYELVRADGSLAAAGQKQGFCFEDSLKYDGNKSNGYHCAYQGITAGWGDWYYKQLPGQWIDITGVPAGDYRLRVRINIPGMFDEGENRYPNIVEIPVKVPDPRNKVEVVE